MLAERYLRRRFREGREEGIEIGRKEGREEGREERDAVWKAWHERMRDAQSRGEPFDEPPPECEDVHAVAALVPASAAGTAAVQPRQRLRQRQRSPPRKRHATRPGCVTSPARYASCVSRRPASISSAGPRPTTRGSVRAACPAPSGIANDGSPPTRAAGAQARHSTPEPITYPCSAPTPWACRRQERVPTRPAPTAPPRQPATAPSRQSPTGPQPAPPSPLPRSAATARTSGSIA